MANNETSTEQMTNNETSNEQMRFDGKVGFFGGMVEEGETVGVCVCVCMCACARACACV